MPSLRVVMVHLTSQAVVLVFITTSVLVRMIGTLIMLSPYARSRGWTTPAKGIIGGAKFVRQVISAKVKIHFIACDGI